VEAVGKTSLAGTRFHFIGAGGIGMSGLARLLVEKHAVVTGSDRQAGAVTARLGQMGVKVHIGHAADNLPESVDVVVISAAVKDDNPELQSARQRGCPVYKYAQLLGALMDQFEAVAVAGTHGKSTTSGWLVYCLKRLGLDVNYVVGAEIVQLGRSSGSGDSPLFVAEACEYDRSFLNIRPKIACVLNIEPDHLDCYANEADIVATFGRFVDGTRPDGAVVVHGEDANVARLIGRLARTRPCVTFGFGPDCRIRAANVENREGFARFDVLQDGNPLGTAQIVLPGRHNVVNALAVVATAASLGIEPERVLGVLGGFTGMDRRLMLKGQVDGVTVLDDYAHHPTEIRASLKAVRQRYQPRRLWCVFQAHQYSRTRFFLDQFAESFTSADTAVIPEIYSVRDSEASRRAVNAEILTEHIRAHGTEARYVESLETACDFLQQQVRAGDVVVTMGAGDVWKVADEYIQRLRGNR
jgi:UDP-N-acetylmuramate--alanine ligase